MIKDFATVCGSDLLGPPPGWPLRGEETYDAGAVTCPGCIEAMAADVEARLDPPDIMTRLERAATKVAKACAPNLPHSGAYEQAVHNTMSKLPGKYTVTVSPGLPPHKGRYYIYVDYNEDVDPTKGRRYSLVVGRLLTWVQV